MQNKQKQATLHTYLQSDKSLSCEQERKKLSFFRKMNQLKRLTIAQITAMFTTHFADL